MFVFFFSELFKIFNFRCRFCWYVCGMRDGKTCLLSGSTEKRCPQQYWSYPCQAALEQKHLSKRVLSPYSVMVFFFGDLTFKPKSPTKQFKDDFFKSPAPWISRSFWPLASLMMFCWDSVYQWDRCQSSEPWDWHLPRGMTSTQCMTYIDIKQHINYTSD